MRHMVSFSYEQIDINCCHPLFVMETTRQFDNGRMRKIHTHKLIFINSIEFRMDNLIASLSHCESL